MDAGTMKDYIEDLIQQVNQLEAQFRKMNALITQLQQQRDQWMKLYEASFEEAKDLHEHLGQALYCEDGWRLREYAIASYSRYEKRHEND
jgi:TolA-binding protein